MPSAKKQPPKNRRTAATERVVKSTKRTPASVPCEAVKNSARQAPAPSAPTYKCGDCKREWQGKPHYHSQNAKPQCVWCRQGGHY